LDKIQDDAFILKHSIRNNIVFNIKINSVKSTSPQQGCSSQTLDRLVNGGGGKGVTPTTPPLQIWCDSPSQCCIEYRHHMVHD